MTTKLRDANLYVASRALPVVKVRDASLYVAVPVAPVAQVRNVSIDVLMDDIRSPSVRTANLTVIGTQVGKLYPNWATPAKANLLAKINAQYGQKFTLALLDIGVPEAFAGGDFNSRVKITPLAGSGYSGSMWMRLNRFSIDTAFIGKSLDAYKVDGTTIHGILSKINTDFGLSLTADEIEDGPYDKAVGRVVLKVKAGSIYYLPGSSAILGPTEIALSFSTTDLSGFEPA